MWTTRFISLAAALAVMVGGLVLAGWALDIGVLKSILPGWVSMKANTARAFILIGIALLLSPLPSATFNPQRQFFFSRLARLCALLAGLIGLLTLGEYGFGLDFGIDQWLFREPAGTVGTSLPGRMAPETAWCFVLLACAVWIDSASRKTSRRMLASAASGLLVVVGLITRRSQSWVNMTNQRTEHGEMVMHSFHRSMAAIAHVQSHARGYVITGDERFVQRHLSAQADSNAALGELCEEMEQAGKASQVEALTALLPRFAAEMAAVDEYLDSLALT